MLKCKKLFEKLLLKLKKGITVAISTNVTFINNKSPIADIIAIRVVRTPMIPISGFDKIQSIIITGWPNNVKHFKLNVDNIENVTNIINVKMKLKSIIFKNF